MKLSKVLLSLGAKSAVIGPFKPTQNPVRSGVYVRVSPKTGAGVYAHYNVSTNRWGLYADTPQRAMERAHKTSKKKLAWYASADSSTARPVNTRGC